MELRYTLILGCILTLAGIGQAARRVDARARALDTMKRRRETVVLKREEPATLDTTGLLQLTEGESLKKLRRITDAHGTTLERMEEEFQGIPVFDSTVTVRKDEHGKLTGDVSGVLIQDIAKDLPDIKPVLRDEDTLENAIAKENDRKFRDLISDVKYERYIYMDDNDRARLVNKVSYLIDGVKKPTYIIDMKNGEILGHWNAFKTLACCNKSPLKTRLYGGNEKRGKIWYGSQPYCLDFTVDECNKCYLENKYVRVVDMKQSKNESFNETASFPCDEIYGDEVNGAYSPAIDSFYFGTVVGKMFEEWYNTTALQHKIVIRVHYGVNYTNAFWNGVNATFGDGSDDIYPFTTMDIVGHEIGHGVVEQGSNLLYYGECGGVNEGFADVMGETLEAFALANDFIVGKYVLKEGDYIREFEHPERDNKSIGQANKMTPYMDTHYSSGVYRRVWYVIVKQQHMSIRDTFMVFLYANQMYWHYKSSFYDVSCGLLKAAMDLGMDTKPFAIAFEDVGIPKCNVSGHIYGLTNNVTQRGITVSDKIQPVFKFSMPPWGEAITIEAISPSGGSIYITLQEGSWEEEEYDMAEIVDTGEGKLLYRVEKVRNHTTGEDHTNGIDYSDLEVNYNSHTQPSVDDSPTSGSDTYDYTTSTASSSTEYSTINETDTTVHEFTTPVPAPVEDYQFFVKLKSGLFVEYNDVELTVGYICASDYVAPHYMIHAMYRYYCFGEV